MTAIKFLLFLILAGIALSGCGEKYIYKEAHPFGETGWTYADSLDFPFEIRDTSKRYDLLLTIHHSPDYEYENLYVKFTTVFPGPQKLLDNKDRVEQVTSLVLAGKAGNWLGRCSKKECQRTIPIQTHTWFPQPGKYRLKVQQFMRKDSLHTIKGVDFAVRISENKK